MREDLTDYAREAYEAYRNHTGGISLASGQSIPEWDQLRQDIQAAWKASTVPLKARLDKAEKERGEAMAKALTYDELLDAIPDKFPCKHEETGVSVLDDFIDLIRQRDSAEGRASSFYRCVCQILEAMGGIAKPGVSDAFLILGVPAEAAALRKDRDTLRARVAELEAGVRAGADAIELLDWLFRLDGDGQMRAPGLLDRWNGEGDFVEWVGEEMRRELHTL